MVLTVCFRPNKDCGNSTFFNHNYIDIFFLFLNFTHKWPLRISSMLGVARFPFYLIFIGVI